MKQSFRYDRDDGKVFGCSFRKANYAHIYFGWVSEYPNKNAYNDYNPMRDRIIEHKSIPLADNKSESLNKLMEYVKIV